MPKRGDALQVVENGIENLSKTLQRSLPRLIQSASDCGILFRVQDTQEQAAQLDNISNEISRRSGELFKDVAIAGKKAQGDLANQVTVLNELGDVLLATKQELARIETENNEKLEGTQRDLLKFADKMRAGLRQEL